MDAPSPPDAPRWTLAAAALALLLLAGALLLFFRQEVLSTLSDVTGGDVAWQHQLVYNAVHGRLFENSVCHNSLGGVINNPWGYANNTADHVNLTPYLLVQPYALCPTLAGYYAVSLLWQYGALALLFWLAARRSAQAQAAGRAWLALAVLLLSSGLFWTATSNGLFPLYLAPCFALMVYGLEAGRPGLYALGAAAGALVSEDSAMFLACFGAVLAVFRPDRRAWGAATAAGALAWSALAVAVLQPASRVGLELATGTNMADRLARSTTPEGIRRWRDNLLELLRGAAVFSPALFFAAAAAGRSAKAALREALPLVLLAPALHVVITVMIGGAHHWMPIVLCLLYAFLRLLCAPGAAALPASAGGLTRPAAAALALYAGMNAVGLYYAPLKHAAKTAVIPRLMGYPAPDLAEKAAHNRRVLAYAASIPPDRRVAYHLADTLTGYAAARSDLWEFPAYFDQADLLVVDKDARSSDWRKVNFRLAPETRAFIDSLAAPDGTIPPARLAALRDRLAGPGGAYRVVRDDADLLVLERRSPGVIPPSPTSRGFSFLRAGPRAAALAALRGT